MVDLPDVMSVAALFIGPETDHMQRKIPKIMNQKYVTNILLISQKPGEDDTFG